jgi:rubrerythrin
MTTNERSLAKEITEGFEALKSMRNNEPVFWACGLEEDEAVSNAIKIKLNLEYYNIPLYTHPVKELTDEEILNVLKKIADNNEYVYSLYEDFSEVEFSKVGIFEFARAILRKAQEK